MAGGGGMRYDKRAGLGVLQEARRWQGGRRSYRVPAGRPSSQEKGGKGFSSRRGENFSFATGLKRMWSPIAPKWTKKGKKLTTKRRGRGPNKCRQTSGRANGMLVLWRGRPELE